MRKSCVIYDSWALQITSLPKEMAGEYTQKLLRYAFFEEEPTFDDPALMAMFASVKNRLDEDLAKYQAQVERAKAASKRNHTKSCDVVTMSNEIKGVNDNDNVNVNVKKIKRKAFMISRNVNTIFQSWWQEMFDPVRCLSCKYGSHDNGLVVCMYIIDVGKRRGCYDGKECTKYEKWDGKKREHFGDFYESKYYEGR